MRDTTELEREHDQGDIERDTRGNFTPTGARQAASRSADARRARAEAPEYGLLEAMKALTKEQRTTLALDPEKATKWLALYHRLEEQLEGVGKQGERQSSSSPTGDAGSVSVDDIRAMVEARKAEARERAEAQAEQAGRPALPPEA